jgi:hypothetical protein
MQRIVLLLVVVCATASAEVYRRTGPDGEVYFSDQPGPDAEKVDVAPVQSITPRPVPAVTGTADQKDDGAAGSVSEADFQYTDFAIVSPENEQGVRANDGNVSIRLSLQPGLQEGHIVTLKLDGEGGERSQTRAGLDFELSNLYRGQYTVEATVLDENGDTLIQAGPVVFYVLRVSAG